MAQLKEVTVPDIGGFDTVDVIDVLVKPGDSVGKDDSLVTLESDKASMDVPAPFGGAAASSRTPGCCGATRRCRPSEAGEYFSQFYEPVSQDRPMTWTPEYSSGIVRHTFDRSSPIAQYATVPRSFVFIQRINLGLYALLGDLRATGNYRRMAEELWPFADGPPSTPLGEEEAAWLRRVGRDGVAGGPAGSVAGCSAAGPCTRRCLSLVAVTDRRPRGVRQATTTQRRPHRDRCTTDAVTDMTLVPATQPTASVPEVQVPDSIPTELVKTVITPGRGRTGGRRPDRRRRLRRRAHRERRAVRHQLRAGPIRRDPRLRRRHPGLGAGTRRVDRPASGCSSTSRPTWPTATSRRGEIIQAGDALTFLIDVRSVVPGEPPAEADIPTSAEPVTEVTTDDVRPGTGATLALGDTGLFHVVAARADDGTVLVEQLGGRPGRSR